MNAARASNGPIRLLVVDRQPSVWRGLKMRLALEDDMEVVGEAGDPTEAIPLARDLRPDMILVDVESLGVSGLVATETLRTVAPQSTLVILNLRDDAATQRRATAAGAAGFVAKHRNEETLMAVIRGVATERRGRNGA